jgi:hypothetical protein
MSFCGQTNHRWKKLFRFSKNVIETVKSLKKVTAYNKTADVALSNASPGHPALSPLSVQCV